MTAEIGIFNKTCAVLAADSAITVQHRSGRKVLNTANKIFTISKYHPVGIMIHNSAQFAGIPWEVIIKEYRNQLGRRSFPTVSDYMGNFLQFLSDKVGWVKNEYQEYATIFFSKYILDAISSDLRNEGLQILGIYYEQRIDLVLSQRQSLSICDEFQDYTFESFKTSYLSNIKDVAVSYWGEQSILTEEQVLKLALLTYDLIVKSEFYEAFSGLFFAGYGDDQIFPSYQECLIGWVFEGRIRKLVHDPVEIDSIHNTSSIVPLAQTEVATTFLKGIDPALEVCLHNALNASMSKIKLWIESQFNATNSPDTSKTVKDFIDSIKSSIISAIEEDKTIRHVNPVIDSVSHLSKEDLIELAESIIGLTSLKQRVSLKEESVGGPVDIAVITKGDGFVWIKRKHYFSKELNETYFQKYFPNETTTQSQGE